MSPLAFALGGTVVYWSSLLLFLGAAAWLALSCSLYRCDGGRDGAVWVVFPLAVFFSLLLCRLLHWYCHTEQYAGFFSALTRYDRGGFCLAGLLPGVLLAAWLTLRLGYGGSLPRLLDALAPGAALGIALIRLGQLFSNSFRGKLLITRSSLQHLPLAAPVLTASGAVEYRFASFFVEFLLLLPLTLWLLRFYLRRRNAPLRLGSSQGSTALLFLLFFSALELVLDSTRYDSSFLRSNGFVSLTQIVGALCMLAVLIHYSRRSLRALGLRPLHILLWLLWLLSLGAAGYLEYLIQRHGNWYWFCYSLMSLSVLLMVLCAYWMYRSLRPGKARR